MLGLRDMFHETRNEDLVNPDMNYWTKAMFWRRNGRRERMEM